MKLFWYQFQITIWGRNKYIDGGFGDAPLEMSINIYDAIEYYLYPLGNLYNSGPDTISKLMTFFSVITNT